MLEQYYAVREYCYKTDLNLHHFPSGEDEYDKKGSILVVTFNDKVIGGARIISSDPEQPIALPLEEDGLNIQSLFPEIRHERYCEFTRLAVLPEFRGMDILTKIIDALSKEAMNQDNRHLFSIAPLKQSRCYKMIFSKLGFNYELLSNITLPDKEFYKGLEDITLSKLDFCDVSRRKVTQVYNKFIATNQERSYAT